MIEFELGVYLLPREDFEIPTNKFSIGRFGLKPAPLHNRKKTPRTKSYANCNNRPVRSAIIKGVQNAIVKNGMHDDPSSSVSRYNSQLYGTQLLVFRIVHHFIDYNHGCVYEKIKKSIRQFDYDPVLNAAADGTFSSRIKKGRRQMENQVPV